MLCPSIQVKAKYSRFMQTFEKAQLLKLSLFLCLVRTEPVLYEANWLVAVLLLVVAVT